MGNIDNKVDSINVSGSDSKNTSNIVIRVSYNPFWYLMGCIPPIAVVKCGECKTIYRERLSNISSKFSVDESLTCPECNHTDVIHYDNY